MSTPIHTTYRGVDVYETTPPSQGFLVLEQLNILEGFDLAAGGFGTAGTIHLKVETKKLAFADRLRYTGDPRFVDNPLAELLSKSFAARRRPAIDPTRAAPQVAVGGTPGGDLQPQWNVQVISNLLDHGMDVQQAVEAPRWESFPGTDEVNVGKPFVLQIESRHDDAVIDALAARGHQIEDVGPWGCRRAAQPPDRSPTACWLAGLTRAPAASRSASSESRHRRRERTYRGIAHRFSTGIHNWYRKLGWERAGRQYTFALDRRSIRHLPPPDDLDVTDDWRPHVAALCALQQAALLGAARDPATFALLAERKARRVFVARRGGDVVAYAALSGLAVRDYAGPVEDVAALLHAILPAVDRAGARTTDRNGTGGHVEMTVLTPVTGDHLDGLLLSLGIPHSLSYLGMMKLLDPPGLLDALGIRDVAVKSLGADDPYTERWRVRHGATALELPEGELVKLFFGPELRRNFAPAIFPLTFWQGPFDRV